MSQPVIKLHNSKDTEFEFDVAIQGPNGDASPVVRFVVENVNGYNVAVECESRGINKWAAHVPAINSLTEDHKFHIEVIVEGYYFVPTEGLIEVVNAPQVEIKENFLPTEMTKPFVSADLSGVVTESKAKVLVEYDLLGVKKQKTLNEQTVKTGVILSKAGKLMQAGFEAEKPLDTKNLNSIINLVKESLESLRSKILIG